MGSGEMLPFRAPLEVHQRQADALFAELLRGDDAAAWRFKWEHPRFRGRSVGDVRTASLTPDDARTVIARECSFDTWADLVDFVTAVATDGPVARFETAVEAVVAGDLSALRALLDDDPQLVKARSARRHHATLLHYIGANGVEGGRQRTPANAVEVTRVLLDAGAEVDALADLYDHRCTTMSMLVSSEHPARAGLQAVLAETLLDYGAALDGTGTSWQSALSTALAFGYLETARALARRGARLSLATAAGLGLLTETVRLVGDADGSSRHIALALAAQHGHADVVELLLDAGEDPNRYNPDGFHSHSTPLHQAVWSGHTEVVRLLVTRGARLDIRDTVYSSTPLGWAIYGERNAIADFLRESGATE